MVQCYNICNIYILIIWDEDGTTFCFTKLLQKYSFRNPFFFYYAQAVKQRQSQTPSHTATDFTADRDIRGEIAADQPSVVARRRCDGLRWLRRRRRRRQVLPDDGDGAGGVVGDVRAHAPHQNPTYISSNKLINQTN